MLSVTPLRERDSEHACDATLRHEPRSRSDWHSTPDQEHHHDHHTNPAVFDDHNPITSAAIFDERLHLNNCCPFDNVCAGHRLAAYGDHSAT
jgi:hypothetical protein